MHDPVLQLDQFTLQAQQLGKILATRQITGHRPTVVRPRDEIIQACIVQFHLQLFVEAVLEFGLQQLLVGL